MNKHILLFTLVLFCAVIVLSCNNPAPPPESPAPADTMTKPAPPPTTAMAPLMSGYLDTLYIASADFEKLGNQITFRFYIDDMSHLTLRGWSGNSGKYAQNPDVELKTGRAGTTQYGNKNFFGNLVLYPPDVAKIVKEIRSTHLKYVLFAPQDPSATSDIIGQINYKIILTDDDPASLALVSKNLLLLNVTTNPSPPRASN
jgi:hypothetical protein